MLPRRKIGALRVAGISVSVCTLIIGISPFSNAQVAISQGDAPKLQKSSRYVPPVTSQNISPHSVKLNSVPLNLPPESTDSKVKYAFEVVAPKTVPTFTLAGLTWTSKISAHTYFVTRVRESGVWSSWYAMTFCETHGVDPSSQEAKGIKSGTDPLLTGLADGIEILMVSDTEIVPQNLQVNLFNSQETTQDKIIVETSAINSARSFNSSTVSTMATPSINTTATAFPQTVVSPQGAVVSRPNIVTRAQWGADETWRDPIPKMGTRIIAGFVHHTATTNNYTPAQAPAEMRNLYAYFTHSLGYADMAYNFLVDKYGTIYEGRAGCVYLDPTPCDGPSLPVQGAHTAGMNLDTFAISAIGNFDVAPVEHPQELVNSIAALMAWKIAPYGLSPNANARITSTDTSGLSQYSSGQVAVVPVISGHRDVGRTACPGKYLYAYLPAIRAKAEDILLPVISKVSVAPKSLDESVAKDAIIQATIPATATWTIAVNNEETGALVNSTSGTQAQTGVVSYDWNRTDTTGQTVSAGRYVVTVNATLGQIPLSSAPKIITLAKLPTISGGVLVRRISPTRTLVTWQVNTSKYAPTTSNQYRISQNNGRTWTPWISVIVPAFSTKKWFTGQSYLVEVKGSNIIGGSNVVRKKYVVKQYRPPIPGAVSQITFTQSTPNKLQISWTRGASVYVLEGYLTRVSINGGTWSAWQRTAKTNAYTKLAVKPGDNIKIQVVERNGTGKSTPVLARYLVS